MRLRSESESIRVSTRWFSSVAVGFLFAVVLVGCEQGPTASWEPLPIEVLDVQPSEAGQGEAIEVRILGSGFQPGDVASWERGEAPDSGVVVERTEFVSEGELVATLNVAADAALQTYDVTVAEGDGSQFRGTGTGLFTVLPGVGSELGANFTFDYQGHRSGSLLVDHTFFLQPAVMFTGGGDWAISYYDYEEQGQVLGAQMARGDGLVDAIDCRSPGERVSGSATRDLECWLEFGLEVEAEGAIPEEIYTSTVDGDRPADGSGRITFTSVTPHRLSGEFSITLHPLTVVDGGDATLQITNGSFDVPIVSSRWNEPGDDADPDDAVHTSGVTAMNDQGVAVGFVRVTDQGTSTSRAARWTVHADGNVEGPHELTPLVSRALGVNNAGAIVGMATGQGGQSESAFMHDGSFHFLAVPSQASSSRANGINDAGVVVGYVRLGSPPGVQRGVVWLDPLGTSRQPAELSPLPGHLRSFGSLVNNEGLVVGTSWVPGQWTRVYWQIQEDGSVAGPWPTEFFVSAVNDVPDFAGDLGGDGQDRVDDGGLLRGGVQHALDPLDGHGATRPLGLNNPTDGGLLKVVGSSFPFGGSQSPSRQPVLWTLEGDGPVVGPRDLALPASYVGGSAEAVNADGWIAGTLVQSPQAHPTEMATVWLPRGGSPDEGYDAVILGARPGQAAAVSYRASLCRLHPLLSKSPRCR